MARRLRPLIASAVLAALTLAAVACSDAPTAEHDIAVRVGGVGLDPYTDSPVVVLREQSGERSLPIWIGVSEARSIAMEMDEVRSPRPNTHDLAERLLSGLEATIDRVVVTKLLEGTYYAVVHLRDGSRRLEIDARPSDAIAIALRTGSPVFVREGLFDSASARSETDVDDDVDDGGVQL